MHKEKCAVLCYALAYFSEEEAILSALLLPPHPRSTVQRRAFHQHQSARGLWGCSGESVSAGGGGQPARGLRGCSGESVSAGGGGSQRGAFGDALVSRSVRGGGAASEGPSGMLW